MSLSSELRSQTRAACMLWNEYLRQDPISEDLIRLKFSGSEFTKPVLPFVSGDGAFALTCTRSGRFMHDDDEGTAWIMALGFGDETAMEGLIDSQLSVLRKRGVSRILCAGFTPTYFFPGIDRSAYPAVWKFMKDYGFSVREEAIAMDRNLWPSHDLDSFSDTSGDIEVRSLTRSELPALLKMLKRNFSSDYSYRAKCVGEKGERYQIKVAVEGKAILGYSMFFGAEGRRWYMPGEHFGPFGVDEAHRSRGIGTALLHQTLREMRIRGMHRAFFLWTSERASRLYERFGFEVTRRFSVFEMKL